MPRSSQRSCRLTRSPRRGFLHVGRNAHRPAERLRLLEEDDRWRQDVASVLEHLPTDHVAYWDLVFNDGSSEERDSSAAAIAVCALQELVHYLPDSTKRQAYEQSADEILASLIANYSACNHPESNALLLHSVYDKPKSIGVDEGSLWGDYFYLEALSRKLKPDWKIYW